jgi:hypothetical protein
MQRYNKPHHLIDHPNQDEVAYILYLVDAIIEESSSYSTYLKLSILATAIKQFEAHRFEDFFTNKTERANQVLHTTALYNKLYRSHLKDSIFSNEAKFLKRKLNQYADSAYMLIDELERDIKNTKGVNSVYVNKQASIPFTQNEVALFLSSEIVEAKAHLDSILKISSTPVTFDYFGVSDLNWSDSAELCVESRTAFDDPDAFVWLNIPPSVDESDSETIEQHHEEKFEFDFDAESHSEDADTELLSSPKTTPATSPSQSNSSPRFFRNYSSDNAIESGMSQSSSCDDENNDLDATIESITYSDEGDTSPLLLLRANATASNPSTFKRY